MNAFAISESEERRHIHLPPLTKATMIYTETTATRPNSHIPLQMLASIVPFALALVAMIDAKAMRLRRRLDVLQVVTELKRFY